MAAIGLSPERVAAAVGFPVFELPDSAGDSAESAIRLLVDHLASLGEVAPEGAEDAIRALLRREQLGSTAVGAGLALPHAKSWAVHQVVGLVGSSRAEIDWDGGRPHVLPVQDALDGPQRVHTVCLLLAPEGDRSALFRTMQSVVAKIRAAAGFGEAGCL
jgi:mannitol/fructose-specific phosphotransferase system IIA component (Ntr-type)